MNDSVILKDILRQYEGQDTHTVHLVCTPRLVKMSSRSRQPNPNSENRSSGDTNVNSTNSHQTNTSATSGTVSPESTQQSRAETDNRVPTAFPNTGFPATGFPWTNYNGQVLPMDPNALNQYQLQMAWMQQAYMQYMAQYMQL